MRPEVREALEKSIEKWEMNTKAETPKDVKIHAVNCPLCVKFISANCEGCPVMERTGTTFCDNSPYGDVWGAFFNWRCEYERGRNCKQLRANFHLQAGREVEFLKSLLPQEPNDYSWIGGLLFFTLWLSMVFGWVINVIVAIQGDFSALTGVLVLHVVGIFVPPLGAVMGWVWFLTQGV